MKSEIARVTTEQVIDDIARKLDPMAFENADLADMVERRKQAYARIRVAMEEYHHREVGMGYQDQAITDADIPW